MLLGLLLAGATVPLGEAWVELPPGATTSDLAAAGALVTEARSGNRVRVLLDDATAARLNTRGFVLTQRRANHALDVLPPGYHTPETGDAMLAALAASAPRAELVRIGTSTEGRPIEGLRFGQDVGSGARVVRVLGTHHGDEPTSYEVALAFAQRLADGDLVDPVVTSLLDTATVWVVPLVNPDGLVAGTRTSASGVDLNRNYDWQWEPTEPFGGPGPFSEPETRAIRALGLWSRPDTALTLHAGAVNLGWPWNFTLDPTQDAQQLQALAQVYANACTTPDFWLTQGSHWYLTHGDTNDWAYGWYGTFDMTLEVSIDFVPDAANLPALAAQHVDAMLAFFSRPPGLWGTVIDSFTGLPVDAGLSIDGGAEFRNDPLTGSWFRHGAGTGQHAVTVDAPGYLSEAGLVVAGADNIVSLQREAIGTGWLTPSVLRWPQELELPDGATGPVTLLHPAGVPVSVEEGGTSFFLDADGIAPGLWSVQLPDGTVLPRALWVDDPVSARVDAWTVEDDTVTVTVTGTGFGEGAKAIALVGMVREVVPVAVRVDSEEQLVLDTSDLPRDSHVDVGLWTNGSLLGLDDVWTPQEIAWPGPDPDVIDEPGCGCNSGGRPSVALVWILALIGQRAAGRRAAGSGRRAAGSGIRSRSSLGVS